MVSDTFSSAFFRFGICTSIYFGCFDRYMSQQISYIYQIYTCLQKMHRFAVTKHVTAYSPKDFFILLPLAKSEYVFRIYVIPALVSLSPRVL